MGWGESSVRPGKAERVPFGGSVYEF